MVQTEPSTLPPQMARSDVSITAPGGEGGVASSDARPFASMFTTAPPFMPTMTPPPARGERQFTAWSNARRSIVDSRSFPCSMR